MDAISSLKLADLKRELRARNLPVAGTKPVLVDRLIEAMSAEKSSNDDSNIDDILDEDSMLGEEESDGDGEDAVAADLTISSPTATVPPTTLSSPTKTAEAIKRSASSPLKTEQNGNSAAQDGAPPSKKKIILNRQPVPEAAPQILGGGGGTTAEAIKAAAENKPPPTESKGEKAVIKLSEATTAPVTEKIKMRQEKFGASAAPAVTIEGGSDRLKKRAERFGVAGGVSAAGKVTLTTEDEAKLAKRRERFGIPTDDKIDELKTKRANRFGLTAKASASAESATEVEEKKSKRAARFAAAL